MLRCRKTEVVGLFAPTGALIDRDGDPFHDVVHFDGDEWICAERQSESAAA